MNDTPARIERRPSLTSRLLRQVTLPLVLTWALGALIELAVADRFTQQALDRSLLDNAYGVASRVRQQGDSLGLGLTREELDAALFDPSEPAYFAVWRTDGSLLAGDEDLLPTPAGSSPLSDWFGGPAAPATPYRFWTLQHHGSTLRAVTLRQARDAGFSVVIAHTTASRTEMLRRLLVWSIAPQIVLLTLLAWWLRRVIRREVRPLAAVQEALDRRDASDLTPIPHALTHGARSRDVERLGVAINALLARVGDGVRQQREFSGNVAHELRTPLAGIRALAEYGLAHDDPNLQREQLRAIVASQGRASHLIDQLLALALADERRGHLQLVPVALTELVRELVLRNLPRAAQHGVDLGASGLERAVVVAGDAALIEGILGNLIDNALRHGSVAGRPAVVTVEVAVVAVAGLDAGAVQGVQDGPAVILTVSDNGPGLAPSERARLLQRWAQAPQTGRVGEGTGLGLAIVCGYAALMQARFELVDGPGGMGLSARVVFPA